MNFLQDLNNVVIYLVIIVAIIGAIFLIYLSTWVKRKNTSKMEKLAFDLGCDYKGTDNSIENPRSNWIKGVYKGHQLEVYFADFFAMGVAKSIFVIKLDNKNVVEDENPDFGDKAEIDTDKIKKMIDQNIDKLQ